MCIWIFGEFTSKSNGTSTFNPPPPLSSIIFAVVNHVLIGQAVQHLFLDTHYNVENLSDVQLQSYLE